MSKLSISNFLRLRWLTLLLTILFLLFNAAGIFFGNIFYRETSILNAHANSQKFEDFKHKLTIGIQEKNWHDIVIHSNFGYPLHGTYIPNAKATNKTIIFLHGFTGHRALGLNYLDIYLENDFNVLLVDSRAHGESGGHSITWGNYEKYDLEQWLDWLTARSPQGIIGVHGVSMGAATALLHAELNETNKRVAFYIADSAYSDLETLFALQLKNYLPQIILPQAVIQYANFVAYLDSRFTFHQAAPIRSVRQVTTPILYVHGASDQVVPAYMSQELYQATKGFKQLHIFPKTSHLNAIYDYREQYCSLIQNFIQTTLKI